MRHEVSEDTGKLDIYLDSVLELLVGVNQILETAVGLFFSYIEGEKRVWLSFNSAYKHICHLRKDCVVAKLTALSYEAL